MQGMLSLTVLLFITSECVAKAPINKVCPSILISFNPLILEISIKQVGLDNLILSAGNKDWPPANMTASSSCALIFIASCKFTAS